jgi:uncharacterized membrane protein YjgN (DUF898 family)
MHGTIKREDSAFVFEGSWREYAPIAFTNLLLTIVTLGIYRFWATTRTRRYLWSRTRFVDENLEWTGTGKELLIGFVLVMLLLLLPFFLLTQVAQAMMLRGEAAAGLALSIASWLMIFYLGGIAQYRALRYRLGRTRWRGIRGGSGDAGFGYGVTYMWKSFVGMIALGLLVPWSMTSLWNERWNRLSFGPYRFEARARWGSIFGRYLLFYLAPLVAIGCAVAFTLVTGGFEYSFNAEGATAARYILAGLAFLLVFYFGLGLIAMAFFAKFYREAVGALRWDQVGFSFTASTGAWIRLLLGNVALVVLTLGIGAIFLAYRHWKFFITHLEADGEIVLDTLTQSDTRLETHGEGLLDAFDIGAI